VAGNLAATLQLAGANVRPNVQQYRLGSPNPGVIGFRDVATPGVDDAGVTAPALIGDRGAKTGLYALEAVDLFNILCIPEASLLDGPGQVLNLVSVMSAAESYCDERRAFVLVDTPPDVNALDHARDWVNHIAAGGLRNQNAAAYFPRTRISDPLNGNRLRAIGASGTMAGIYARTDGARGVWKAPAGIEATLSGVVELDVRLTDPENGQLNPIGLNVVRTFDNIGTVVWGARTLVGADELSSDWKYVPVRRLALYVEESLFRGLQWVVFEPNDEPLWGQIRLACNSFMQGLFRQSAFQGSSPKEAYLVKCDSETTTQADIDLGIVNVLIGFAPLKPAEFVIVSLQLLAGQSEA
jgi:phage tail sheath protein FI